MTKGRLFKSSSLLWLSHVLSLTGQSNPWCNSNYIWLFLIFLAGRDFLLNLSPTNLWSCKKNTNWPNLFHCVTVPSALQLQLHTWSVLCPLSMWLLPGCAMSLGRQMSGLSLASREQLWSFPNISAKQMASFHLFPTIDLDLFFRVDTTIIYFSGASGKAQRWDTHLWLPSLSYTDWSHQLGDTISHSDSTTGGLSLPLHLAELGLPEQWEM